MKNKIINFLRFQWQIPLISLIVFCIHKGIVGGIHDEPTPSWLWILPSTIWTPYCVYWGIKGKSHKK